MAADFAIRMVQGTGAALNPAYTSARVLDAELGFIFSVLKGLATPSGHADATIVGIRKLKDKIKELGVAKAANGTCVQPTDATIADGSYPLSRSLYLYVNKAKAAANPAVAGYVDFYLADGTISKVLETVPYVNLPSTDLDATRAAWEASK